MDSNPISITKYLIESYGGLSASYSSQTKNTNQSRFRKKYPQLYFCFLICSPTSEFFYCIPFNLQSWGIKKSESRITPVLLKLI